MAAHGKPWDQSTLDPIARGSSGMKMGAELDESDRS